MPWYDYSIPSMKAAETPDTDATPCVKKTVSLPSDLMEAAILKAKKERRNFSNYILRLIADDLESDESKQQEVAP